MSAAKRNNFLNRRSLIAGLVWCYHGGVWYPGIIEGTRSHLVGPIYHVTGRFPRKADYYASHVRCAFLSGTFFFTNILFLQVRGSGGFGLATFCGSRAHEGIRSTRVESVVLADPESRSEAGCPSSRRVGQRFHREWMAASEWRKNYYILDPLALCSSGPYGNTVATLW